MDFGLARSMEATGMTQAGAIMGTPAYMSPEQAKGVPADERSDIFSLGIIAYQMLTGVVPFEADTALASMLLRTQGPSTSARPARSDHSAGVERHRAESSGHQSPGSLPDRRRAR